MDMLLTSFTQTQLKEQVAQAAARYIKENVPKGSVIGVGTGSTVNLFIDALAADKHYWRGAVSSSEESTARLQAHHIDVLSLNEIDTLSVYVDGADEITPAGWMTKGGGGALTREKIITSVASTFVCIADASKYVEVLGKFPVPVEVIPMARMAVTRALTTIFPHGTIHLRHHADGTIYVTDNGCEIIDVSNLHLVNPIQAERDIESIVGVVSVGLFAQRGANMLLLGTDKGVQTTCFN